MVTKAIVAIVFLSASASIVGSFYYGHFAPHGVEEITTAASAAVFMAAAITVFLRTRLGYWLGLAGAVAALPFFIRWEISLAPWNSWLALNCEAGPSFESSCGPLFMRFRILAFVFIAISVACAVLRLLPVRWSLGLWPAFAASFLGLATWFVHSASPYRLPMLHDYGMPEGIRILHVEKRGLRFHETCVFGVLRDGRFWSNRADRRWFQYSFDSQLSVGSASPGLGEHVRAFVRAAKVWNLHTPPPRALWAWNAEGWYVVTPDRRFSFVGTQPPEEVRLLFRDLESYSRAEGTVTVRDVCLGFCYDLPAALGLSSMAARSWLQRAE